MEDLPAPNEQVASNNPLRGMITSPLWVSYEKQADDIPTNMDFYYIGLDTTMTGPNAVNWGYLESLLNKSAAKNRHAILRFMLDYPNDDSFVPSFLLNQGLAMTPYDDHGGGVSPDYASPVLLDALEFFIRKLGDNYDGDSRIAFVQVGLLGFWGEWHTYPHNDWIPDSTKTAVATWFDESFDITPLQIRSPHPSAKALGFGFHDDSFAHSTLSDSIGWFFWPRVEASGYTDFWKSAVMGGELRPELQSSAFSNNFPDPNNDFEQDYDLCVETTHATYMLNNYAFTTGYAASELARARASASRMGYQFHVTQVQAFTNTAGTVDLHVDITQAGVAPFYYALDLSVSCDGLEWTENGVETIVVKGDMNTFVVSGLPPTTSCLEDVVLSLDSPHAYPENPVKFAQGTDGEVRLSFKLPM